MTKYYQILGKRIVEITPGEFFSGSSYSQIKKQSLETIVKKSKEGKNEKKTCNPA